MRHSLIICVSAKYSEYASTRSLRTWSEAKDGARLRSVSAVDVVGARRAGLRPVLLDPLEIGVGGDYPRLRALSELPGVLAGRA